MGSVLSLTNLDTMIRAVFCQKTAKVSDFGEKLRKTQQTDPFRLGGGRTIALDCHEVRWPLEGIGRVQVLFRSPKFRWPETAQE